jgi:hypothetical protein
MFPINEGFSDYTKSGERLIVKVDEDISSHPGVKSFIGLSRIDGRRIYELNPIYFYGYEDLASQLHVSSIELVKAISSFV